MTLDEFLAELRAAAPLFHWRVVDGRIRGEYIHGGTPKNIGSAHGCCPIEAVYFSRFGQFVSVGRARQPLVIPEDLFEWIILRADDSLAYVPGASELRRQLLEAVELNAEAGCT